MTTDLCVHTDSTVTLMLYPVVQRLHPQLQREEGGLLHASETIRDLLGNVSDVLSTLRSIKTVR